MMSSISNRPMRMSATVRMQSRHCALPTRMLDRPGSRSIPKKRWMDGRRMFAPMSRVFWPLWAIVRARFTIVVVLPSCKVGLDTTRTLPERSMRANWMLVRSVRYASATGDFGSKCVIRSEWLSSASGSIWASAGRRSRIRCTVSRESMCGTTPSTGTPR